MTSRYGKRGDEHLQHEADRVKPTQKNSVIVYILVLFAAAFLLLMLSYFMQLRNSQEAISGLRESVSAMQSVQRLQEQNATLQEQNEALEEQVRELGDKLVRSQAVQQEQRQTIEQLKLQLQAMDWLREIQGLYERKYYRAARTMIEAFEASGLASYLPETSLHQYEDEEVLSPAAQYQLILDKLN